MNEIQMIDRSASLLIVKYGTLIG